MSKDKNSGNQVVIHLIVGLRVLGGFIVLIVGWALFVMGPPDRADIANDPVGVLLGGGVFVAIWFLGLWLVGYTFRLTFDYSLENMTITTGIGPFKYRTKYIFSKKEVWWARAMQTGEPSGQYQPFSWWAVSLGIGGRKAVRIVNTISESKAKYLADRINAFIQSE